MQLFKNKKKYESFRIAVMAVIFDEHQRILLAHRTDRDFWNLPGGKMEKGETPWAAMQREVYEEIGVRVSVERLVGVYSYQQADHDMVILTFHCVITEGQPVRTPESDNIAYFDKNELPTNLSHRQQERISDAFLFKKEAQFKQQT